jgi:arylsulfatase A-like enzyme
MKNGAKSPRETFYYVRGAALDAVREGPWKYRFARAEGAAPVPELFHLENDPAEQYNVYEQNRELGERLAAKLKAFAAEIKAQTPA